MKRFRFLLSFIVVVAAIAVSSFTVLSTRESKKAVLYWYQVTYDAQNPNGVIPNSSAFYVQADKASVSSPCPAGAVKHCLRGFTSPLSSFPSSSTGMDQILKP